MLLETGVLLMVVTHTQAFHTCPDNCRYCEEGGKCTVCIEGYDGDDCSWKCSEFCKDRNCYKTSCLAGCVRGRYGVECTKHCHKGCKDGICNQMTGYCANRSPPNCKRGICSEGCEQYCDNTSDKDEDGISPGLIISLSVGSFFILFGVLWFSCQYLVKKKAQGNRSFEGAPSPQGQLPRQPATFNSSNRRYPHMPVGNIPGGSENVMSCYVDQSCANRRDNDVTSSLVSTEIPSQSNEKHPIPPPSYASLFKKPSVPPL